MPASGKDMHSRKRGSNASRNVQRKRSRPGGANVKQFNGDWMHTIGVVDMAGK